ncbi:hypothetical protein P5673_032186 [Acropora cervicornis]|uniref:Uncharacterized protein n=1 Tax=Acropora cervicornis TaxID=6130 RepID=A0AAD9PRL3_ACRCE|nr:hypothetical protein P5673_032186 [Acropora cervicornis]
MASRKDSYPDKTTQTCSRDRVPLTTSETCQCTTQTDIISINNNPLASCTDFKYLGSTVPSNNNIDTEITNSGKSKHRFCKTARSAMEEKARLYKSQMQIPYSMALKRGPSITKLKYFHDVSSESNHGRHIERQDCKL